jgi:hypothetical protein
MKPACTNSLLKLIDRYPLWVGVIGERLDAPLDD